MTGDVTTSRVAAAVRTRVVAQAARVAVSGWINDWPRAACRVTTATGPQ